MTSITLRELVGFISGQGRDLSAHLSGDGTISYQGRGFQYLRESEVRPSGVESAPGALEGTQCHWELLRATAGAVRSAPSTGETSSEGLISTPQPFAEVRFSDAPGPHSGRYRFFVDEPAFAQIGHAIELLLASDTLRYRLSLAFEEITIAALEGDTEGQKLVTNAMRPLKSLSFSIGVLP